MREKETYFKYLDNLRESGVTNMFGAMPYLMDAYSELDEKSASAILVEWMGTFTERHPTRPDRVRQREGPQKGQR